MGNECKYKLKATKDELYKKGFYYNKSMSDDGLDCYSIRFWVLKYNKIPTVDCELTVELQTGNVLINVYNHGTNDIYVPYYNQEYGNYKTLDIIENEIQNYIKRLGIKIKEKNNE